MSAENDAEHELNAVRKECEAYRKTLESVAEHPQRERHDPAECVEFMSASARRILDSFSFSRNQLSEEGAPKK